MDPFVNYAVVHRWRCLPEDEHEEATTDIHDTNPSITTRSTIISMISMLVWLLFLPRHVHDRRVVLERSKPFLLFSFFAIRRNLSPN
jgi:hypothetical protein